MPTVLVIENNAEFRAALIDWLRLKNFAVLDTDDSITGLQLIAKKQPDLVICELDMQGVNGFGVLQALRYNPSTSQTPFLLISSEQNCDEIYDQALCFQANGCLEKSRIWQQLVGAIRACM
jgi:CheY-like chemotaxis protein